ncbi:Crp/Fnr family transcriptional regulator [Micromonospora sp. PLK6-60]|uniref:Crp/Fnr family transcriptional regulator n=1 Tax=Micromonospora sp. PLK6-60 TaxID=2873383 RepID=UPI001CA60AA9|nr:Crp/Fnr family transcriptional regulator [Micromonospora sp. PLK6-60]MBY8871829.1 Crp/Fnr family transcriptional regulator [Micromonospora sp. PLK6-60]
MVDSQVAQLRAALSRDEIAELERLGIPVDLAPGTVLFAEGDTTTHAVLIRHGQVKVVSTGPHGQEVVLATRGPGEVVGEMAPLDHRPRSATVVAVTPVQAAIVSDDTFNDFLDTHPRVMRFLLQQVVQRLRDSDHGRVDLATLTVAARVAATLLELAVRSPASAHSEAEKYMVPDISQTELAGYVGASREAVAKVLRDFRSKGMITTARRAITIDDAAALRAISAGST